MKKRSETEPAPLSNVFWHIVTCTTHCTDQQCMFVRCFRVLACNLKRYKSMTGICMEFAPKILRVKPFESKTLSDVCRRFLHTWLAIYPALHIWRVSQEKAALDSQRAPGNLFSSAQFQALLLYILLSLFLFALSFLTLALIDAWVAHPYTTCGHKIDRLWATFEGEQCIILYLYRCTHFSL